MIYGILTCKIYFFIYSFSAPKLITASGLQTTKKTPNTHIHDVREFDRIANTKHTYHVFALCMKRQQAAAAYVICHIYMVYVHIWPYFYTPHKYIYRDVVTKIDFASSSAGHHQFPQGLPLKKNRFYFLVFLFFYTCLRHHTQRKTQIKCACLFFARQKFLLPWWRSAYTIHREE